MVFIAIIVFALVGVFVTYSDRIWQVIRFWIFYRTVPGPTVAELIENEKKEKVLQWMYEMSEKYGGVFRIWLGRDFMVYFSKPDDMQQILSSNQLLYKSNRYDNLKSWLGNGLLTNGGESWHQRRKLLTPAFHFRILSEFKEPIEENCRILVSRLREHVDGAAFDIYPYLTLFALDVICETAMGIKKNAQLESSSEYVKAVESMCHILHKKAFSFWERINVFHNLTGAGREMQRTLKVLHGETDRVIKLRRRILQESNIHSMAEAEKFNDDIGSKRRFAFLDILLINQMEAVDNGLKDRDIREEVDTFMFEGHDTTSSALGFAIYFLSQNADVQQKAYQEASTINGKEKEHMPYLEAVIKETLRLYPSVALYSRQVVEDIQIGNVCIPKGASIVITPYTVHRNKKYFPQPEIFDPERFLRGNEKNLHPFTFFAFSAGPRNCIGQKFAMLELKCTLSHLLRNYEFLHADHVRPIPITNLTIKSKNGIHVKIKLRKQN